MLPSGDARAGSSLGVQSEGQPPRHGPTSPPRVLRPPRHPCGSTIGSAPIAGGGAGEPAGRAVVPVVLARAAAPAAVFGTGTVERMVIRSRATDLTFERSVWYLPLQAGQGRRIP